MTTCDLRKSISGNIVEKIIPSSGGPAYTPDNEFLAGEFGDWWLFDNANSSVNSDGSGGIATIGDPAGAWASQRNGWLAAQSTTALKFLSQANYAFADGFDDFHYHTISTPWDVPYSYGIAFNLRTIVSCTYMVTNRPHLSTYIGCTLTQYKVRYGGGTELGGSVATGPHVFLVTFTGTDLYFWINGVEYMVPGVSAGPFNTFDFGFKNLNEYAPIDLYASIGKSGSFNNRGALQTYLGNLMGLSL